MNNNDMIYPLSPMQQGMLFHTIYAQQESGTYVEQFSITLHNDLNLAAFKQAWQQIVERHAVLRTTFHWEGLVEPIQKVHKQATLQWQQLDWCNKSETQQQKELETFRQADFTQGFQLNQAPLMRCTLIQTTDNTYQFIWTHHHLILDGCSLTIILKEIISLYNALCHKQTVSLQEAPAYHHYITWLEQQNIDQAEVFWKQQLKAFNSPTPIQIDSLSMPKLATQPDKYTEQHIQLSSSTTKALQAFAQQYRLTLNSLIQSAWALLLSRYNGKNDVIFGATVWQRPAGLTGAESMVGLLINTVPVRIKFAANDLLIPSLQKWQAQLLELEQYSYTSLLHIQKWSELPNDNSLFDSIVFFDDYPINTHLTEISDALKIDQVRHQGRTDYPLTILISPGSELLLRFMYDGHCFNANKIQQIMAHLRVLLEAMFTTPLQRLYELPILTETEQQQFKAWNNTHVDYPNKLCLHHLFEAQVKSTPEAIAVIFKNQKLSYTALNHKANQLAHHLQNLDVKPGAIIGICIERSIDMLVGLLAILKAGAAYLPLEPTCPAARLELMLEDAKATLILTKANLDKKLPETIIPVLLDTEPANFSSLSTANPVSTVTPLNLAYVIYTSGSTGKPKGVMVSHQAITNHTFWMQANFPLDKTDKVLQKTPFSFDASIWEFYAPLTAGAQLIIAEPNGHQDPAYLINVIIEQHITTIQLVPSLLHMLLEQQRFKHCQSLKRIFCGGETLPMNIKEQCLATLDANLYNLYGPTEACIDATYWACQRNQNQTTIPIGRPIANTKIYILDNNKQALPIGIPGELYIGGIALATGYMNLPELTAKKFIETKLFGKTERIYKTGDLAKWLADGNIDYLGRIDHQVKLRGFRIEPGEIESVLNEHPEVNKALVITQEYQTGDKRLIAYLTHVQNMQANSHTLRLFLKEKLPEYMIPSAFIFLDQFPLSASGKIDRKALPAADKTDLESRTTYVGPRSPTEEILANLWQDVLNTPHIGIYDNFFELGGHSLLAVQLTMRINQQFQVDFPLYLLFEKPTVAEFSMQLSSTHNQAKIDTSSNIKALPRKRSKSNLN